jgi:hypothetical protein
MTIKAVFWNTDGYEGSATERAALKSMVAAFAAAGVNQVAISDRARRDALNGLRAADADRNMVYVLDGETARSRGLKTAVDAGGLTDALGTLNQMRVTARAAAIPAQECAVITANDGLAAALAQAGMHVFVDEYRQPGNDSLVKAVLQTNVNGYVMTKDGVKPRP